MLNAFRLFGDLVMRDDQYRAGLKGAETATQQSGDAMQRSLDKSVTTMEQRLVAFGQRTSRVGDNLSKFVTGPIVALGGAALAMAGQLGSAADAILDLGDKTGLTTDQVQAYRAVTREAGISTDLFATAAEGLTRRLSATGEESTSAQEGLALIGVTARTSTGELRSMDDMFPEIIRGLASMENPTQRNALAVQLLGRSALELAPALGLGADRIDELTAAAMQSGEVMSGDALTSANDYRIAWENMTAELGVAWREMQQSVVPAMTLLVEMVRDHAVPVIRALAERVAALIGWFSDLEDGTQKVILVMVGVVAAVGPVLSIVGRLLTALPLLTSAFAALRTAMLLFTGPVGIAAALATALGVVVYRALRDTREEAGRVEGAIDDMAGTISGSTDSWDALASSAESAAGMLRGDARQAFIDYANEAIRTSDSVGDAAALIEREWRALAGATSDQADSITATFREVAGSSESMESAITGSLGDVRDAFDATADDAEHVLLAAIREAASHLRGDARDAFLEYAAQAIETSGTVGEAAKAIEREWHRAARETQAAVAVYSPAVQTAINKTNDMRDALMGAAATDEDALRGAVARAADEIDGPGKQAFINYAEEAIATASTVQEAARLILREWARVTHAAEIANLEMRAERIRQLIAVKEAEAAYVLETGAGPAEAVAEAEARLAALIEERTALQRLMESAEGLSREQQRRWTQVRNEIEYLTDDALPHLRRNAAVAAEALVEVHDPALAKLRGELADTERQLAEIVSGVEGPHDLTVLVRTKPGPDARPLRPGGVAPTADDPLGVAAIEDEGIDVDVRYHVYVHDGVHGPETWDEYVARLAASAPSWGERPGVPTPSVRVPMIEMIEPVPTAAARPDATSVGLLGLPGTVGEDAAAVQVLRDLTDGTEAYGAAVDGASGYIRDYERALREAARAGRRAEEADRNRIEMTVEANRTRNEAVRLEEEAAATAEALARALEDITDGSDAYGAATAGATEYIRERTRATREAERAERVAEIALQAQVVAQHEYTASLMESLRLTAEATEAERLASLERERAAHALRDITDGSEHDAAVRETNIHLIVRQNEATSDYTRSLDELRAMGAEATQEQARGAAALERARLAYEATDEGILEAARSTRQLTELQYALGQATGDVTISLEDVQAALDAEAEALQRVLDGLDKTSSEYAVLAQLVIENERARKQNTIAILNESEALALLRLQELHPTTDAYKEQLRVLREIRDLRNEITGGGSGSDDSLLEVSGLGPALRHAAEQFEGIERGLRLMGASIADAVANVPILGDAVKNMTGTFEDGVDGMRVSIDLWGFLADVLGRVLGASEQFQKLIEVLGRLLEPLVETLDMLLKPLMPLIEAVVNVVNVFQRIFSMALEPFIFIMTPVIDALSWFLDAIVAVIDWLVFWRNLRQQETREGVWADGAGSDAWRGDADRDDLDSDAIRPAEGSVGWYREQRRRWEWTLHHSGDADAQARAREEIARLDDAIRAITHGPSPTGDDDAPVGSIDDAPVGSIDYWREQQREWQQALTATAPEQVELRVELRERIREAQDAIDAIIAEGVEDLELGYIARLREDQRALREQLAALPEGTDDVVYAAINRRIRNIDEEIRRLQELGLEADEEIVDDIQEDLDRIDFGGIPQTIQFAVATPLAEAADRFLFAVERFEDVLDVLSAAMPDTTGATSWAMSHFTSALERHTPVMDRMTDSMERWLSDGVRLHIDMREEVTVTSPTASLRGS